MQSREEFTITQYAPRSIPLSGTPPAALRTAWSVAE